MKLQRAHDELTATHTDAHQEVDGGVHVDILEIETEHAERVTKGPGVVQVIVDPQRQREHLRRAKSVKVAGDKDTSLSTSSNPHEHFSLSINSLRDQFKLFHVLSKWNHMKTSHLI